MTRGPLPGRESSCRSEQNSDLDRRVASGAEWATNGVATRPPDVPSKDWWVNFEIQRSTSCFSAKYRPPARLSSRQDELNFALRRKDARREVLWIPATLCQRPVVCLMDTDK